MVWLFTRGSAQIYLEVRRISHPDGYELGVSYSRGSKSVQRYTNPRRLVERALALQRHHIGDGWMPSGPGMYGVRAKVRPRARVLRGQARLWAFVHRQVTARLAATF